MGASLKGAKIWETEGCDSLLEFREWCDALAAVLGGGAAGPARIPHLEQLALHRRLEAFPQTPIAAVLEPRLVQGGLELQTEGNPIDLVQLDLIATRRSADELGLRLEFEAREVWRGALNLRGEITRVGESPAVRMRTGEEVPLVDLLNEFEPYVYFADGSSTQAGSLFERSQALAPPPADLFDVWDWEGCDITHETGARPAGRMNVQDFTVLRAIERFTNPLVVVDHNSGEIADVVAIERLGAVPHEKVRVNLMHCKGSSSVQPGTRVDDLHEVLGQTVRSTRWAHPRVLFEELKRRWDHRPNISVETAEEADDVAATLAAWAQQPPETDLRVWTVQPGLARGQMEGWNNGNTLISAASEWCASEGAPLRLATSP
jgi:hypothetical protein